MIAQSPAERADDRAHRPDPRLHRLIAPSDGGRSWPAAIVFGVAGVTDQVDGFLARRWHVESAFGKIADPLADRLMIDAAVILLLARRPAAVASRSLIPARDVLVLVGTPLVVGRGYEFEVNMLGKVATWLLYASLGLRDGDAPGHDSGRSGSSGSASCWRCVALGRVRAEGAP